MTFRRDIMRRLAVLTTVCAGLGAGAAGAAPIVIHTATVDISVDPASLRIDATTPDWDPNDQGLNDNGRPYIHWSYSLMSDGDKIPADAFRCPSVPSGGAPRTNPGRRAPAVPGW